MTKQCLNDQRRSGGGPGREVFFVLGPREVDSALGASTLGTSRLCRSKQSNRAMLELKNREIILNYYRVNSCKKNAIIKGQPSPTQSNPVQPLWKSITLTEAAAKELLINGRPPIFPN